MQSDHEERLAAEAQGEMRVVRIIRHARVMRLSEPGILVGEGLRPRPEVLLERLLREVAGSLEHHGEALE
jgi:hypothetical protein